MSSNSTSFVRPRLLGEAGCPRAAGPPLLLPEPCPTLPTYPQCQRGARNQWRKKGVKGGSQRHQAWPCPGLSRQLPWEGFPGWEATQLLHGPGASTREGVGEL